MSSDTLGVDTVVKAAPDQLSSKLGSESVILNLTSGVYYGLDPVGSRVWELIRESKSIAQIRDQIVSEYDVDPKQCEEDIARLLKQMQAEGLLQIGTR